MGLAVAGLKPEEVKSRTEQLASGDWKGFPASHQAAFLFSRKQANNPGALTAADLDLLEKHFGPEKMWQVVWWSARCHYMTRVADAFQLPLEKENVFLDKPVPLRKQKK
ncbi:MAG: hypothetical protein ACKO23_08650 [Gemmataceae bacterium]